jgi:hypothetical protein
MKRCCLYFLGFIVLTWVLYASFFHKDYFVAKATLSIQYGSSVPLSQNISESMDNGLVADSEPVWSARRLSIILPAVVKSAEFYGKYIFPVENLQFLPGVAGALEKDRHKRFIADSVRVKHDVRTGFYKVSVRSRDRNTPVRMLDAVLKGLRFELDKTLLQETKSKIKGLEALTDKDDYAAVQADLQRAISDNILKQSITPLFPLVSINVVEESNYAVTEGYLNAILIFEIFLFTTFVLMMTIYRQFNHNPIGHSL